MTKCSKFDDLKYLNEDRLLLNAILDLLDAANIETKRIEITQLASRTLDKAKSYKQAQYGDVTIDRQLKQVRWICRKSTARLKHLALNHTTLMNDCAYHRTLGDLCRYMSVVADIPRVDRAPTTSETAEHTRYAILAIKHYEQSKISVPLYTEAIRKMLYAGAKPLTALMLTIRYYSIQLSQKNVELPQNLSSLEDAATFLQGSFGSAGFLQKFGGLVLHLLKQLRLPLAVDDSNLDSNMKYEVTTTLVEDIIKEYNSNSQAPVAMDVAYTAVLALSYLGHLLVYNQLSTHLISRALRSDVLFAAAAEIRFRPSEFSEKAPFLASLWQDSGNATTTIRSSRRWPISEIYAKLYDYIHVPEPFE